MTTYAEMTADQLEERGFNVLRVDGATASAFFAAAETKRKAQERALATYETKGDTYYSTTVNNPIAKSIEKRRTQVASLGLLGETAQASLREKAHEQEINSRGLTYPAQYTGEAEDTPSEATGADLSALDTYQVAQTTLDVLNRTGSTYHVHFNSVGTVVRALNEMGRLRAPESPSEAPEKPSWDYVYRRSVQALGRAQGDQYEQVREVIRALNRLGLLDYDDIA